MLFLQHEHFGTMSFKEVATGAINATEKGFIMHELMAQTIKKMKPNIKSGPQIKKSVTKHGHQKLVIYLFNQILLEH